MVVSINRMPLICPVVTSILTPKRHEFGDARVHQFKRCNILYIQVSELLIQRECSGPAETFNV